MHFLVFYLLLTVFITDLSIANTLSNYCKAINDIKAVLGTGPRRLNTAFVERLVGNSHEIKKKSVMVQIMLHAQVRNIPGGKYA
ncbi:hypothetical protein C8R11_104219 [Nitrosomonas aestuarii]|nr:hypothetical protein C8R11_104219 [Nitrosomonas aestuarii]